MRGYRLLSFPVVMIAILAGCSQGPPDAAPRQKDPPAGPPRQIDCDTLEANPGAYVGSRVIVYASELKRQMRVDRSGIVETTLWFCSSADGTRGGLFALFMTRRTGRDMDSLTGETWGASTRNANRNETLFRISGTARNIATYHFPPNFNPGQTHIWDDVTALMIEEAQVELANGARAVPPAPN